MREEELTFTVEEEEGQLCLDQVGREYGMALFSAGVCKVKLPPGSIPRKEAQAAAQVVEKKVDDITRQLDQRGINYQTQNKPFSFKEAASRCRGRIDIRIDACSEPFKTIANLPALNSLPEPILSSDMKLSYTGIVTSLPGLFRFSALHLVTPTHTHTHMGTRRQKKQDFNTHARTHTHTHKQPDDEPCSKTAAQAMCRNFNSSSSDNNNKMLTRSSSSSPPPSSS